VYFSKHGIKPSRFFRARRPVDYRKLLDCSGFLVLRDSRYSVNMEPEEREEWRKIPAFSRRWGQFKEVPRDVSAGIRKEIRKAKLLPWPENRVLKSRWRLILARARNR